MIWLNVQGFLACWYGITIIEISDFQKVEICFNHSVCVGSSRVCADKIKVSELKGDD